MQFERLSNSTAGPRDSGYAQLSCAGHSRVLVVSKLELQCGPRLTTESIAQER
jgi:hypothetical protein